ncbi:class II aldolase/adducin family protein [candidate division WOR-3 bacterium]|nr:class II aldolase/adducin family protein [candidate division WOR-3 bacterium]
MHENHNFPPVLTKTFDDISNALSSASQREWTVSKSGNYSIDLTGKDGIIDFFKSKEKFFAKNFPSIHTEDSYFLLSCAGADLKKAALDPARYSLLVSIGKDGTVRCKNLSDRVNMAPTSELLCHLLVHGVLKEKKPEHRAVLHLHPPGTAAFSALYCLDKTFKKKTEALLDGMSKVHSEKKGSSFLGFFEAGSEKLAIETAEVFSENLFVSWAGHGAICSGKDLTHAFERIEFINWIFDVILKVI